MKIYRHMGNGHWIGSVVAVVAIDRWSAEQQIRGILDEEGLEAEELNITEILIFPNTVIVVKNGDY